MEIERIGVVGAGQMGNGIAHVAALAGYGVVLTDVSDSLVQRALGVISKNMDRQVSKGSLDADGKEAALGRIKGGTSLAEHAGCQLVVEAIVEDFGPKAAVFR